MTKNEGGTADTRTEIFVVSHHGDRFSADPDSSRVAQEAAEKAAEEAALLQKTLLTAAFLWILACASSKEERTLPPKAGEALLLLFCSRHLADVIAGDLQERFEADVQNAGLRRAKFRYWIRVVRSAGPLIFARLRNWGLFAAALEYGRRKIGL
jgi:hypothetical protein